MGTIAKLFFKGQEKIKVKLTQKGHLKMDEEYARIERFAPVNVKVADANDFYTFTFSEFSDFFGGSNLEIGDEKSQLFSEAWIILE